VCNSIAHSSHTEVRDSLWLVILRSNDLSYSGFNKRNEQNQWIVSDIKKYFFVNQNDLSYSGFRNAGHNDIPTADSLGEPARRGQPHRTPHHQPARGSGDGEQGELGSCGNDREEAGAEAETEPGQEEEKK